MPDPPSKGFLRGAYQGLFGGGGPKPCDREELFGEAAGKIGSNVAKHIPGKNMAMEQLQGGRAGARCGIQCCSTVKSALMLRSFVQQKLNQ